MRKAYNYVTRTCAFKILYKALMFFLITSIDYREKQPYPPCERRTMEMSPVTDTVFVIRLHWIIILENWVESTVLIRWSWSQTEYISPIIIMEIFLSQFRHWQTINVNLSRTSMLTGALPVRFNVSVWIIFYRTVRTETCTPICHSMIIKYTISPKGLR